MRAEVAHEPRLPPPGTAGRREGGERPLLLFFCESSSGPCRRVEAFLAQVLQRRHNHDTFRVVRVHPSEQPALAQRMRIHEVPTLVVVDHRHVARRIEVPRGRKEIEQALRAWLH